jgi:hypothetical protein
MLEAILVDHVPLHVDAKKWLCDDDTWVPSAANDINYDVSWVERYDRSWNERYAMAVFYYSTNGNGWSGDEAWLSPISVCDWGGTVSCDSDSLVTLISLCESCLSLFPPVAQLQQVCHLT